MFSCVFPIHVTDFSLTLIDPKTTRNKILLLVVVVCSININGNNIFKAFKFFETRRKYDLYINLLFANKKNTVMGSARCLVPKVRTFAKVL